MFTEYDKESETVFYKYKKNQKYNKIEKKIVESIDYTRYSQLKVFLLIFLNDCYLENEKAASEFKLNNLH